MKLEQTNKTMSIQGEVLNDLGTPVIYLYATVNLKTKNSQIQWNIGNYEEYMKNKDQYSLKIKEFQDLVDLEVQKISII